MQITSNVTNPSFTARLKNNEITTTLINNMGHNELKEFNDALVNLKKVYPNDIIELKKGKTIKNGYINSTQYLLVNKDKKTEVSSFSTEASQDLSKMCKADLNPCIYSLIYSLQDIANPENLRHKKIFSTIEDDRQKTINSLA